MKSTRSCKSKIIFIRLHSGIGNQLFQYNYLNFLKSNYNITKVYFDLRSYYPGFIDKILRRQYFKIIKKYRMDLYLDKIITLNKLNPLLIDLISKIRKLNSKNLHCNFFPVTIDDTNYRNDSLISRSKVLFLTGVFLDKNLLQNDTIDSVRKVKNNLFKEKIETLNLCDTVSIHIRGGDILEIKRNRDYIQPITLDYYKKSIKIIESKITNPNYFVFSNDDLYAQKICSELNLHKFRIIKRSEFNDLEALFLMSYCSHNIIVNSSYSYWAAILNENKNKIVVCPKYFLNQNHFLYETVQKLPFDEWFIIDNRIFS